MAKHDDKPKSPEPFHNPFATLQGLRKDLPRGPDAPLVVPLEPEAKGPARAVLRKERQGRGGKEVTAVEKLELSASELERWCKELKQSLGCGGSVEGDRLIFQGDQRDRLEPLLTKRGVRKVVRG